MTDENTTEAGFAGFGLTEEVLAALDTIGYETPSSIQARCIPEMMAGSDLVGQAQTGTGKTAAFALPILSKLHLPDAEPQALVLTPTRELAIQVAEAFQRYAAHMPGFHVIPIYGGQAMGAQLKPLRRGVHVIVATPGRLADHLRRGSIKLDALETLVIDEADEMLRMGFIEEVEWILQQTPQNRQIALFSATMPPPIRRIAQGYLQDPVTITVEAATATAATIRQRYWMVSGVHKLDALTRILEGEEFDAMLVFVRTKTMTTELAAKLGARGFAVAALNGDIAQAQREAVVERLKRGDLDIVVATDVAARGLDVPRISHVVNYDIPYDTEAYIHRIGRTGRAGRSGQAILFVAPRERRLLRSIEVATGQPIELMRLPTVASINDQRVARFKQRISEVLATEEIGFYFDLVEQFRQEHNVPALEIAAALALMAQGESPLLLDQREEPEVRPIERDEAPRRPRRDAAPEVRVEGTAQEMFRIEVGRSHGAQPGGIVGAIANEGGIPGKFIGAIKLHDDYSTVVLPAGLPGEALEKLKHTRLCGQELRLRSLGPYEDRPRPFGAPKPKFKKKTGPPSSIKKPFKKGKPGGKPK